MMPATPLLNEAPVFVVGSGRSGTTLMRSLLSAHSRISIAPETHYLKGTVAHGGPERGEAAAVAAFWKQYRTTTRFQDLGIAAASCDELMEQQGPRTFRTLFCAMLEAYRQRTGKARVGEKTPSHIRYIATLLDWFPEGRVVVMQRDPRAIIASKMKNPWVTQQFTPVSLRHGLVVGSRLHAVANHGEDWVELYEEIVPRWRDDPRVLTVAYEALVRAPVAELKTVCAFLREPYEPAMLDHRSQGSVPMPEGEVGDERLEAWRREHQAKTLKPVSAASLNKWRAELSLLEVAMIEGRCGRRMHEMGYAPSASPAQRWLGRLTHEGAFRAGAAEHALRAALRTGIRAARRARRTRRAPSAA